MYVVSVKQQGGCVGNSDTTGAEMISLPDVSVSGPNTICNGEAVELSVASYPDHTYYWKLNGNEINNATASKITVDQIGQYHAVIGKSGCVKMSAAFDIQSFPLPEVAFTANQSICANDTLDLDNQTIIPELSNQTVYYKWFFGNNEEAWEHRRQCIRINYSQPAEDVETGIRIIAEEVKRGSI